MCVHPELASLLSWRYRQWRSNADAYLASASLALLTMSIGWGDPTIARGTVVVTFSWWQHQLTEKVSTRSFHSSVFCIQVIRIPTQGWCWWKLWQCSPYPPFPPWTAYASSRSPDSQTFVTREQLMSPAQGQTLILNSVGNEWGMLLYKIFKQRKVFQQTCFSMK